MSPHLLRTLLRLRMEVEVIDPYAYLTSHHPKGTPRPRPIAA